MAVNSSSQNGVITLPQAHRRGTSPRQKRQIEPFTGRQREIITQQAAIPEVEHRQISSGVERKIHGFGERTAPDSITIGQIGTEAIGLP